MSAKSLRKERIRSVVIASTGHTFEDDFLYHRLATTVSGNGLRTILCAQGTGKSSPLFEQKTLVRSRSRAARFVLGPVGLLVVCLRVRPSLVILASPDLLVAGLFLRLLHVCKVVYYALEDYSAKLKAREWIPRLVRLPISRVLSFLECASARRLDGTFTADAKTARRFSGSVVVTLPNYPDLRLICMDRLTKGKCTGKVFRLVYVGGIALERGLAEMAAIPSASNGMFEVHLYGRLSRDSDTSWLNRPGVFYHGLLPWPDVLYEAASYDAGLCLFRRGNGYDDSAENTTKLYEYMLCSLPVIASDLSGLKAIVNKHCCGITVDERDISSMVSEIAYLAKSRDLCDRLGANGYKAVVNECNWEKVSGKLLDICEQLTTR